MGMIDVSRQRRSFLADATVLENLPAELLAIIQDQSSTKLLDAVAEAALCPPLTERVFAHFEHVFPDICARWILNPGNDQQRIRIYSALARILPFAPYLSTFIEYASSTPEEPTNSPSLRLPPLRLDQDAMTQDGEILLQSLLVAWRLISFDSRNFGPLTSAALMQTLFKHESKAIRYLATRIFIQLLHGSDWKLESLIQEHIGKNEAILADFDGRSIDYGFLSLYEQSRVKAFLTLRQEIQVAHEADNTDSPCSQTLTPYVVSYGNVILPRPLGPTGEPSNLVLTPTTVSNLERLATMLRESDPVMLYGLPGVGKTALVHEIAKQVGMYSNMVTLHLNEQTDAKMLIGLYSTDTKPGSFQWRPGVLTTAVREGRWVLVEDLDRAPTEVLSTLLPLIERKELLIPSRGERIRAASTFRLFATVRTSRGMNGRENLPSMVGIRFWQTLSTQALAASELEDVLVQTYPILRKFIPGILAVYARLSQFGNKPGALTRGRNVMDRQMTLRDLLKWCRRLRECLVAAGSKTGEEPISETTRDWMFMEAVDCFVGSCPDAEIGKQLIFAIAEEMHLSKERAEHYVTANIPPLDESENQFSIGRAVLRKKKQSNRVQKSKRPFASTAHAKKLLEQIAVAVKLNEPVLLVGETGIGKTTVVQQLAESLGHKLIAVNLSQQSEVGDLLGGFKPVNTRTLAMPLKEEFEDLFSATGISASKNQKYLEQVGKCFAKSQWSRVSKLWREAPKMFNKIVKELERVQVEQSETRNGDEQPTKRRKTQSKLQTLLDLRPRWDMFARNLEQFDVQISGGSGSFAFSFMEGNLVKAVRNGDWVLLDEINLASPDTLESIADLLTGPDDKPSILLSETGEIEKIEAHPNFRIFGAMNPATDIGKRDLPVGIRSRFTEVYVSSPDKDLKDLLTIIKTYLGNSSSKNDQAADDIARLYLNTKRLAEEKRIVDGANEVPHFSLRTLTRVLSYVNTIAPFYGVRRALYEGFSMGFLTLLDRESEKMLVPLITHHLFERHGNSQSLLSQAPKHPNDGKQYVRFKNKNRDRQYWLFQGNEIPIERDDYIITPYVERNLLNLVRATSTRRFPILIQGPTSAGKTSMIEYLANFTGNKFVRINNHEHTDLQEYLGTYISGSDGKLRFQEGILVQAMRQGHWIVLDELNLAPTDVLEALNRLLDDNRELLIPETQEIVKPHENFILFATQNPPGLYGGRKVLSRAFRNRFLELHFDDIPEDELEFILQQRSRNTSPPDCRRIVTVYKELSRLRQTSRLFEQKDSFATLRDLFRWALREAETREEIAAHGFMLLAERVRDEEERIAVKEIIEKVFKVKIDPQDMYSATVAPELKHFADKINSQGVVWTHAMRRLYVLVSRALRNNEPVLLVGETGCGKTTVVQLLAEALKKELHIVNAHQNTETGDLIGSQRPVRNRGAIVDAMDVDLKAVLQTLGLDISGSVEERLDRYKTLDTSVISHIPEETRERISANETRSKALFEWADGSLVESMREGHFFLLDEISLADDSVLERLNSVLEPSRTLLLAEKGIDNSFVVGADGFQFFATMNPGGDFGKKELSPALRNRFTEIWVPALSQSEDIYEIVKTKLKGDSKQLVEVVVKFAAWFGDTFRSMASTPFSVREILVWVQFINHFESSEPVVSLVHGASTIFIDSIGANPSALLATDPKSLGQQRQKCVDKLSELIGKDVSSVYQTHPELSMDDTSLTIGHFSIPRASTGVADPGFAFHAPTTRLNAMRVLRALQMQKPILLEGSPGVGKTTLVAALSQACGQPLTRINLSDQTDLMDLFGTDVPVEGAEAGNFAWRDAPFLQAMQKGEWVLLDEMNLASQSVLEGLNACLDHRGEVYISELDQVFKRHPDFRLFAAQNPHHQGGGRKGLPASFVNRFIVVYADVFSDDDLNLIAAHNFPKISPSVINQLIQFVSQLDHKLSIEKSFGSQGSPWEFNLRDVLRWLKLLDSPDSLLQNAHVDDFLDIIVRQRFRSERDREEVNSLFTLISGSSPRQHGLYHDINPMFGQVGLALLDRHPHSQPERLPNIDIVPRLPELESLMICVKQNVPCILGSPSGYGKSVLLEHVAALAGKSLVVFPMNADIDTMDLVGGFEQADPLREVNAALRALQQDLQNSIMSAVPENIPNDALHLLHLLDGFTGDIKSLPAIAKCVRELLLDVPTNSEVATALSKALIPLEHSLVLENPRFEWLDGVIVKALQMGQWLVLDNANMCNASVLDRLNSLLEPNGFLSINEHCGPGGEPRIVRPHPDFRIFLTMDPRYGELSRAMRNRAVEIHIHTPPPALDPSYNRVVSVESSLQRYNTSQQAAELVSTTDEAVQIVERALETLSVTDVSLLPRFFDALPTSNVNRESLGAGVTKLLSFLHSTNGADGVGAVSRFYGSLPLPDGLIPAQPLHPLNNFPVTQLSTTPDQARWLGACLEFYHELYHLQNSIEDQRRQAQVNKLTALNRLQRSLVSDRVAAVSKDATVKLASFLVSTINAIKEWLAFGFESPESWMDRVRILRGVVHYLERTVRLSTETEFDEAKFQAHLAQGANFLQKQLDTSEGAQERDFVLLLLERLGKDFTAGFKLSTGLSMELLWHVFRPTPLPTKIMLDRTLELEKLGSRFDALRWKAGASITDLAKAMVTLEKASGIFRGDVPNVDSLLQDLTTEIESLESRIGADEIERKPFMLEEFEVLRQVSMLSPLSSENAELQVLSDIPTQAGMMLASSENQATLLQSVDNLVYQNQFSWDGKFVSSFWSKLQKLGSVNLGSLALLEAELPIAGRQLANLSAELVENPLTRLNNVLSKLILNVFGAHGQHLRDAVIEAARLASAEPANNSQVFDDLASRIEPDHYRQIAVEHFVPALKALATLQKDTQRQAHLSAFAWIHFSIGTVKLYVPDRVFDPQSRPKMEREFLQEMHALLAERTDSLHVFEKLFTGQSTSERIRLLEAESTALGPLPEEVRPIYRPEQSELNRLHAEFSNVLKAVTGPTLSSGLQILDDDPARATEELQLVRENILRLLDRLSARFEAYQDMTRPTSNLLRCLMIGLSLCDAASARDLAPASQEILKVTPFLGGSMWNQKDGDFSSRTFEFLNYMSVVISVEGIENIGYHAREMVFKSFHNLFDEWTKRLEVDRKEQAANGSLYRFRGSLEDEEEVDAEEFNELFPTFDEEEAANIPSSKKQDEVRDQSLRVAQIHKNLFLDRQKFGTSLKDACKSVGDRITSETVDHKNIDRTLTSKMLAGTMYYLNDKIESLNSSSVDKSYNFYTDANVPEARRLVDLMHKLKARFRELQLVDEIGHMQPLADVIQACDQVLELVHSEPLAKILPKVEYLHGHVYEWQFGGWASKIYGVLNLHNLLTETIIRWRRLELSTWANLFDMEQKKCQDDAYSWWFVAYQVVIAVPLSLVDAPTEMEEYASSLIASLETYFSTAIVGQYGARLALLRQLQSHMTLLAEDYPILEVVLRALSNFIQYYSRYERIMDEAVHKGRTPIEKKMKDVLLMASWKDTNINALRESARKSHQKLFRIIRKFRGILGQEAKQIIEQRLPDQELRHANYVREMPAIGNVSADVFSKLNATMPGWIDGHKRLANVSKTVSVMRKISENPEMISAVPQTVAEFVTSLNESMAELRKETPPFLNDENKDQIKHLKTRKRKLFADTLRDLRQMGLKHNLGQDKLAEQESLSVVLSSIQPVQLPQNASAEAMEYYLHKILDLAPKVRLALRDHSEDLTSAEIGRSVGFFEGMLSLLVSQRNFISSGASSLSLLKKSTAQFNFLGLSQEHGALIRKKTVSDWTRLLTWLVQILQYAIRLVEIHAKLGEMNHVAVLEQLKTWYGRFESLQTSTFSLKQLPEGLSSETSFRAEAKFSSELTSFRTSLEDLIAEQPKLSFILAQIAGWTMITEEASDLVSDTLELATFANAISTLCDKILVAIEGAKKAAKEILRKEDEPAWLTTHSDGFMNLFTKLRTAEVERTVSSCIIMLQQIHLNEPHLSQAAMSLIAIAGPILNEYVEFSQQTIMQVVDIHSAIAHMAYNMTRTLTQISSQGFCTPHEKSDETSNESGKVESGTGLGDGEGAEDISKDIQPDEDLSELAQEANKEENGEMEDEKDAVDMADEELEGDMGSVDGADDDEDGSKNGDEEEEENEMDEEAGDVDDLDPTAVDEKMWDGDDEEKADKDQQGDKAKGQKKDDEQMAADEDAKKQDGEEQPDVDDSGEQDPEEEEIGDEDEDVKNQEEMSRQDQTAQENDTLALPDDMELDINDDDEPESDSDNLDDLSDIEEEKKETEDQEMGNNEEEEEEDDAAAQAQLQDEAGKEAEAEEDEDAPEEKAGGRDEVDEEVKPEEEEKAEEQEDATDENQPPQDNATTDNDNAAPSDVKSSGQDQNADSMDVDDNFQNNAAQQEDGEMGEGAADQDTSAGNQGSTSQSKEIMDRADQEQEKPDSARSDPFKKLGDALERWHRQQEDIKDAEPTEANEQDASQDPSADQGRKEFQHLQDDETATDTQAMGTADDEQVQPIDESMAIDEEKQDPTSRLMEEDKDETEQDPDKMDTADPADALDASKQDTDKDQDDTRSGVQTRQGKFDRELSPSEQEAQMEEQDEDEVDIQETSTQLSTTHISDEERPLRDFGESMQQWSEFQTKTHSLSLALTSQLRLILTPSQSTKLSGAFRTGKRLNIKRIIPYIASSYKRDKIWMRRSIPTKRTYQILLCVDDSKSMGETSSGTLAMESLVMVSRSLTMLEAGQVGIMGFGSDVFTAHGLTEPFASDAGAKVLQKFNFSQDRTDIALLIQQTIETFRLARQQGSGNADLWQLALILSDGLTPSSAHEGIRRMLREAMEERIMIVFIIMDDTGKKKGDSVLELKEAKFVRDGGESKVVIERYLDTFPFQYYLIVHHLEELPSALAGLLRTWFAEVNA
ncbi:midasin (AAA ATPase) [Fusarium heterosporum]|uniref:Midasin n=1 Tax=Fusarium heterosporum TaxID=42747 RepID=A0A8H5SWB1_FUSHE|nr:midasin (AAA ATPase) [Fusarium heterosporum]